MTETAVGMKARQWQFSRSVVLCVLLLLVLLLTTLPIHAQDITQTPSTAPLVIDVNPLLGLHVVAPTHAPHFFESPVTVGGDVYVAPDGNCASGYTTAVPTLGLAWIEDSGAVDLQFVPTRQRGHAIALFLWDVMAEAWRCTEAVSESNLLQFSNMEKGIYFVWILTQDRRPVEGVISVVSPPPLLGSESSGSFVGQL
jgi:hypothetical protein